MKINRRRFVGITAAGVAANVLLRNLGAESTPQTQFKAIAFDAFPIFDPRPVFALAETLFPGKGAELSDAWRTRQFEYQWLCALAQKYEDFERATEAALVFACKLQQLELTPEKRAQLMGAYFKLRAWPEVPAALASLRKAGLRLVFLSNMTARMLEAGITNSELGGTFEMVLSTDKIKTYKPEPRAYQLGIEALGLKREEILFVAFAGWDVAGAKWFGYPTFWVNRLKVPAEELGVSPDATGESLTDLVKFVKPIG